MLDRFGLHHQSVKLAPVKTRLGHVTHWARTEEPHGLFVQLTAASLYEPTRRPHPPAEIHRTPNNHGVDTVEVDIIIWLADNRRHTVRGHLLGNRTRNRNGRAMLGRDHDDHPWAMERDHVVATGGTHTFIIVLRAGRGQGRMTPSGNGGPSPRPATLPAVETSVESAIQYDTNIDDLDPRVWPRVIDLLLAAGAHDAWVTPMVMKKGRPAFTLSALCSEADAEAIRRVIFTETSTIGLRETPVRKFVLPRAEDQVEVGGEAVRIKTALLDGHPVNRSVEWDDVAAAADALGLSAKDVLAAAIAAALDQS